MALRSHDQFMASHWSTPPLIFFFFFCDKVVELPGGGSVIKRAYPVLFLVIVHCALVLAFDDRKNKAKAISAKLLDKQETVIESH